MTDSTRPHRYLSNEYVRSNALPLTLISQDEMVRRIEDARLEGASAICPTCESTVVATATRTCYRCRLPKPITAFAINRKDRLGREYRCKACKRAEAKKSDRERYWRKKREQFREILGVAS